MNETSHDAVVVSPVSTLRHILMVSAFRALIGMAAVVWLVGNGALPILIPGIAAFVTCSKASWGIKPAMTRVGLCLSSSMWIGASAAVVVHDPVDHSIFLAIAISSFAITDIMLASMRIEKIP